MSSSSSKQTVGYWYRYLQHFGLCEGPVDALLEFRAGDRTAWRGLATHSQRIHVNKPKLWGGEEKEGGLRGDFDLMMGEADQAANDYLTTQLGPDQPTHRGKASIVWRGGRWGAMNPYPKPPAFKLRRVLAGWENDEPWYPEKAEIVMIDPAPFALYFALDGSTSMNETTPNGQSRVTNMKTAVTGALQAIGDTLLPLGLGLDIMIVFWGGNSGDYMARQSITRRGVNATTLGELIAWVNGRTPLYGTYFPSAVADAASFFAGSPAGYTPISLFVTDGAPTIPGEDIGWSPAAVAAATAAGETLLAISDLRAYGFNIDLDETEQTAKLDNSGNEVPVVAGGDPSALTNAILEALGGLIAMNPIHILYDTLTSSKMRGEPVGMIPDAWWRAAADVCHAEGFGLCTTYEGGPVRDFQRRICDVIAASVTQSRADGLYYVDLIRGDYDIESLPVIGADDIHDLVIEPSVVTELTNEIIVRWRDPQTRQDRTTAPVQSLGAIQCAGRVYSDTRDYPEIPTESLALRVAARDCQADSTPKSRLLLTLNRRAFDLRPGRRFRLQGPEDGIADMVCLIAEGDNGTLLDGRIQFRAIQDVFGMPSTAYVQPEPGLSVPGDGRPVAAQHQRVIEAPYVELVTTLSRADLDYLPADAGFILTMAARPASGLNYGIATAGVGEPFETRGAGEWCPTALIVEAAGHLDTDFTLSAGSDLDDVEPGTWALWDDEIVRVDALDADTGTVTLGRGCADTVPATHDAGSRIWFCGDWVGSDAREYAGAETVRAKILTRTTSAELSLSAAPQLQVDMDSRQARPYPPGDFRIDGIAYPAADDFSPASDTEISWAHRDRTLQADQNIDTTMGSIGPEPGTTYTLQLRNAASDAVLEQETGITEDSTTIDTTGRGVSVLRFVLFALRDGIECWQRHVWDVELGLWTPAALSIPPREWLDDESTRTISGGTVVAWESQGDGAGANAVTGPTVLPAELNGRDVLYFNGSVGMSYINGNMYRNVSAGWVLAVYRQDTDDTSSGEDRTIAAWATNNDAQQTRFALYSGSIANPNRPLLVARRVDGGTAGSVLASSGHTQNWVMVFAIADFVNRTAAMHINGTLNNSASGLFGSGGNTSDTATVRARIGRNLATSSPRHFIGKQAAVLLGAGMVPTQGDIDRLFGWAAHRYGLTALLPSDHPYKAAAPLLG